MAEIGVMERFARSPLAHLEVAMADGLVEGERGVTLRELAFVTMVTVRVATDQVAAARIAEIVGAALPTECGEVGVGRDHQVLWLGPDEFLVVSGTDPATLTAQLEDALGVDPGLVVDVSANRTTLELSGPSAREVLEKGCVLDLHPRAFRAGIAVSTMLGPVPVILWQTDASPTYRIMPRGSFADYTARWLLNAMIEFSAPEESSWR
ncbi:MAG: sarcosine oxidase subunit gamma family protein [Terrimesophilobacter sp.]